jgi:hypothetical protein
LARKASFRQAIKKILKRVAFDEIQMIKDQHHLHPP